MYKYFASYASMMKILNYFSTLLFIAFMTASCAPKDQYISITGYAQGGTYTVKLNLYDNGTRVIAVTPHSNTPGSRRNFWSDGLRERFIEVKSAIKEAGIPIQILSGQEIFAKGEISELLKKQN